MEKINVHKLFVTKGIQIIITIMAISIAIIVNIVSFGIYAAIAISFWINQIINNMKNIGGRTCDWFKKIIQNWKT